MSELDRPPLPAIMYELIEDQLRKIDERHEQSLLTFSVNPDVSPGQRAPAKQPRKLMNALEIYAGNLFVAESAQYEGFKSDESYSLWLVRLKDRIIRRIFETIALLQQRPDVRLDYHGLTDDEIRAGLNTLLLRAVNEYAWVAGNATIESTASTQANSSTPIQQPDLPLAGVAGVPSVSDRQALRDSYRATFPDAGILDICWAARQRYSEWKRWLRGALKDGSTPDKAFRTILSSGKLPQEYRKQPRPDGWK